jgi:hypothetical protein
MIVCLLIILAGYALIFGLGGLADRLLRAALGLALILSVLPGLLARLDRSRGSIPGDAGVPRDLKFAAAVLFLAGVGYFAWRARERFARRRAERERRWSSPRERVPPPPSVAEDSGSEGGAP